MTITVLLATDGSRVWAALGKHSLWSAADLMEAVSRGEALPAQATYIANHGVTFEAFVWDNEIRELAPGYTLEHHDLAELLARPTVEELQAAKAADHASTLEAYKLGSTIQQSKIARLEAEIADLHREQDELWGEE